MEEADLGIEASDLGCALELRQEKAVAEPEQSVGGVSRGTALPSAELDSGNLSENRRHRREVGSCRVAFNASEVIGIGGCLKVLKALGDPVGSVGQDSLGDAFGVTCPPAYQPTAVLELPGDESSCELERGGWVIAGSVLGSSEVDIATEWSIDGESEAPVASARRYPDTLGYAGGDGAGRDFGTPDQDHGIETVERNPGGPFLPGHVQGSSPGGDSSVRPACVHGAEEPHRNSSSLARPTRRSLLTTSGRQ